MDDYMFGRKLKLLYLLYVQLYGLVSLSSADEKSHWNLYEADESDVCMAELKGSHRLSIDERLNLHKQAYRRLRSASNIIVTNQGMISLLSFYRR